MSRFADRLQSATWRMPGWMTPSPALIEAVRQAQQEMPRRVAQAQIVVADNVAEYLFAGTDQEEWDIRTDFPNLAPPFPSFFVEYHRPSKIISEVHGEISSQGMPLSVGALFQEHPIDELRSSARTNPTATLDYLRRIAEDQVAQLAPILADKERKYGSAEAAARHLTEAERTGLQAIAAYDKLQRGEIDLADCQIPDSTAWVVSMELVIEYEKGTVLGPLTMRQLFLDRDGQVKHWMDGLFGVDPRSLAAPNIEDATRLMHGLMSTANPCLLAVSFMHCKGVVIHDETPPLKLSRAHQKRHGHPLRRFHTLEITPFKKTLEREGDVEHTGLKKALHICRGHFKTFSEEKPLFGRHAGTYWWGMHLRGSEEAGVVDKNYQINPPPASRVDSQ